MIPDACKLASVLFALLCVLLSAGAATTNGISPGQIIPGSITAPAQTNFYTFTATSNDVVSLALLRTNAVGNPVLTVFDPMGEALVDTCSGDGVRYLWNGARLTMTGTYTVVVRECQLDDAFDYLLSLTRIAGGANLREAGDDPEPIVPGQISHGHIGVTDLDTYTFTATSNDVVSLALLRTNAVGNPVLTVFDPMGDALVDTCSGDGVRYLWNGARLTMTGTYTVVVRECQLDDAFDYLLSLTRIAGGANLREAGDDAEPIVPGQIRHGHVGVADLDTYTFTATSNDVVSLALLRTNAVGNPVLTVFDPMGEALVDTCSGDGVRYLWNGARLTMAGTYTVVVRECQLDDAFDYTLCMIKVPGPNFPEIGEGSDLLLSGETRGAQITPGDLDAYSFSVIAGDSAWITLSQTSGSGQAYVYVYDPAGNVVESATSPIQTRFQIPCSTNTGNYTIAVFDSALSRSFTYNLTLLQNPGPPPSYDPAHPYLAIFRCMTNTVVRWPTNAVGFQLEFCTDLCASNITYYTNFPGPDPILVTHCFGPWTNVPPPYAVIANHYYVTNHSQDPMRFYHLKRPTP